MTKQFYLSQVPLIQVRVDLGVMAIKGYFTFLKNSKII